MKPTRVAIIGSGPSGCTLAALLAKKGVSVAMFDDGARPVLVVGESLIPQMVPIFQRMGIEDAVAKIGVVKPGVTVTFSETQEVKLSFNAVRGVLPTYAYNVPRKEFDKLLEDTAIAGGARIVRQAAKLETVTKNGAAEPKLAQETVDLVPEWNGEHPDILIDASGRRRLFANLLGIEAEVGLRKDVAHFAHYENCSWPKPAGTVFTMRLEHGWGWRIPLPGPRLSLGVVINKEYAKQYGSTPEEQLENIISNEPRMKHEYAGRRRVTDIATYTNYQLISKRGSGANWAMVGDAYGFADPMLSPGLAMAMVSAEQLADAIPASGGCDGGLPRRLAAYVKWFRVRLSAWQDLIDYFYDGRIFAMYHTGLDMGEKYPGVVANIMHRHVEKNLSGMASGAYIARPYSRWLLRTLGTHFTFGADPKDFAIR